MTHKYDRTDGADPKVSLLSEHEISSQEEKEILASSPHNGKDHFQDLPEALTERDILQLRSKLQAITHNGDHSGKKRDVLFDLVENHSFQESMDEGDPDGINHLLSKKPLPRIHLHHHRRAMTENLYKFYLEQMESGISAAEGLNDPELSEDLPLLEDALRETDIMNLREKLHHISASSSWSNHSPEEIECYLEGNMTPYEMESFESELSLDPLLNMDLELFLEVDEALQENDILLIRDKLGKITQSEHSSSKSLQEVDAFLEGELTEDERIDFVNEMFEQRDLRAEVNLLKNLEKAMDEKDVHSLRNKLKEIAEQAEQEGKVTGSFTLRPGKLGKLRRKGTYAAIFFILLGISSLIWNIRETAPPGYDGYFKNPQIISTSRSVDAVSDPELYKGLEFLNKLQYSEALNSFGMILQTDKDDQPAHFYSGFTNQKINRHKEALYHFDKVVGEGYNMFTQQAEWYSIQSKIRLYGIKRVFPDIDAVISRKGYYYSDALALKTRLQKDDK